jgi:pimeloyl-ACP methyl ester carboxylesterase
MNRILVALTILLCMLGTLAVPAVAAPVDQAGWNARKQMVALPNGLRVAYVEAGDPDGPPLLLLHGWTDSSRSWTTLLPHLSKYRLLILDQRGHGASDKPECCYALSSFAYDAKLFLDAKGVRQVALVGHSLGSMVGQVFAATYPERVSKLVLIGSTALAPTTRGDYLWNHVSALSGPIDPDSQFGRDWHPANSPTPVDPDFAAAAAPEIYATPLQVTHGVLRELVDVPIGRLSRDIKAPTLILSGGKDVLFPPEHHQALVAAIPHAEARVFPDLGHNLNWERPQEVASALTRFLDRP